MAHPGGRPKFNFTPELQDEFLIRLSSGEPAYIISKLSHMPSWQTLCRFKRENEEFRDKYTRAKIEGIEAILDEVRVLVRDESKDYRTDSKGETRSDNTSVLRHRLIADQAKWEASKLFPEIYGDKQQVKHEGSVDIISNVFKKDS